VISNRADNLSVRGTDAAWYLNFTDECAGVGALDFSYALEEASEFVGKAACPYYLVRIHFYQMPVFKCVAIIISACTHKIVRVCWGCILVTSNALSCHCIHSLWLAGVCLECHTIRDDNAQHLFSLLLQLVTCELSCGWLVETVGIRIIIILNYGWLVVCGIAAQMFLGGWWLCVWVPHLDGWFLFMRHRGSGRLLGQSWRISV
jgi:hypothetical protein